jgi:hypothetical protein
MAIKGQDGDIGPSRHYIERQMQIERSLVNPT